MKVISTKSDWETAPYEQYVLITEGGETRAFPIGDDEPLDLETHLAKAYPDHTVHLTPDSGGSDHASIITDGRPPSSVVVWTSGDFYLEPNDD